MVRCAVADEALLPYLKNLAKPKTCTVGLILGQPTPTKDYIVHFAKTPECQDNSKGGKASKRIKDLADVQDIWVADHAKQVTRMLSGGMYVLGIFIVSQQDVPPTSAKLKSLLNNMHKQLGTNTFLYGNPSTSSEKLVLNYCIKTQSYSCKTYDVTLSTMKPLDFKFQPKPTEWNLFECKYELDQIFPILLDDIDLTLKRHMTNILKSIDANLKSAIFSFDGEIKEDTEEIDSVDKSRKSQSKHASKECSIQVAIYLPCAVPLKLEVGNSFVTSDADVDLKPTFHHFCLQFNSWISIFFVSSALVFGEKAGNLNPPHLPQDCKDITEPVDIKNYGGHIKLTGQVACKLWLHSKVTARTATKAVTEDLIRSLAARLEMHWDSLTEEEHGSPEDTNSIHEPPRRVKVILPDSEITVSDYLFPGEGPQDAQESLKDLLDITLTDKDTIKDIEGQADLEDVYNDSIESESHDRMLKDAADTHSIMYIVGLTFAFLVLVISLIIHFLDIHF